jgi:hypothetical protein
MKKILLLILFLSACAASQKNQTVRISGFNLLIISDIATDNLMEVSRGNDAEVETTLPISGVPVPIAGAFRGGGIMSASVLEIESATGGTIVIERGVAGNLNVPIQDTLRRILIPTAHPFGNVTVDGNSAMREHVDN